MENYLARVAKALNKSPQTIRVGLQLGKYDFGVAFKRPGSCYFSYTIYPQKVKDIIGIDLGPLEEVTIGEEEPNEVPAT